MKNHVPTLQTCQKLKAAGFPQEMQLVYVNGHLSWRNPHLPNGEVCAAPLLTEILEKLSYWRMYDGEVEDHKVIGIQDCLRPCKDGNPKYHANPTEAAALLWLELNTKD